MYNHKLRPIIFKKSKFLKTKGKSPSSPTKKKKIKLGVVNWPRKQLAFAVSFARITVLSRKVFYLGMHVMIAQCCTYIKLSSFVSFDYCVHSPWKPLTLVGLSSWRVPLEVETQTNKETRKKKIKLNKTKNMHAWTQVNHKLFESGPLHFGSKEDAFRNLFTNLKCTLIS